MAERYTSKRYLADIGVTPAAKPADTSQLSRAISLRTETIGSSIDVMKKFVSTEMKKQAARSGMKKALESDPYEIISQTEQGFLSYEDEVSRKHAMVRLKNETIGNLQTGIDLATQESLKNDDSSEVLKNKLNVLVNQQVKSLRDMGIDSPFLELEIRESIASPINNQISSYATARAKLKQDLFDAEVSTSVINSVANAARFNDNVSIQKMNDTLQEHKEYINSKDKLQQKIEITFQTNKAQSFVDKVNKFKNYAPSIQQIRELKRQVADFESNLKPNPHQDILLALNSAKENIAIYEGKSVMSADIAFTERSTKSFSEYNVSEQKSLSTHYRSGLNIIDTLLVNGQEITNDVLTEIARIIVDTNAGPVQIDEGIAQHLKALDVYASRAKEEFQLDERGFYARRTDSTEQMIFNGNINQNILLDRAQINYSLVTSKDIADFEKGLDKTKPLDTYKYVSNFLNSAGEYKSRLYGDVREKLSGEPLKLFRGISLSDQAQIKYGKLGGNEFITMFISGINKENEGLDKTRKASNQTKINNAINEVLPEYLSSGRIKPGLSAGIKETAFYMLYGKYGDNDFNQEEVSKMVNLLAGNKETENGQVNGYVGNYYLSEEDRPNIFANAESIQNGFDFLSDETLPLYTFTLNEYGEFQSFKDKVIGVQGVFDQLIAGEGVTKGGVELTAEKIKTYFTVRNAEPSDWGKIKLPVDVYRMGVFEDSQGNIVKDLRGNPVLIDMKLLGHEYLMKGVAYDMKSSIKDYRYTIGGLKATKPTIEFAGGPGRGFDPEPARNYYNEIIRFRQQGMRNAE